MLFSKQNSCNISGGNKLTLGLIISLTAFENRC